MTHLVASHLSLGYGRRIVVHDFSLEVAGGSVIGLTGPNGSGKSSILRALAGLATPRAGQVSLDGRDTASLSSAQRARRIGLVPQGEHHAWALTVDELVLLGRAAHRGWLLPFSAADRAAAECALAQTDLLPLRNRPVDKLSGGERQRVLIARALAQEPSVLLLDEPTANLDLRYQMQILGLVRRLAYQGLAVVVAIHDLGLAARYCDELLLLCEGKTIARGTPPTVLTRENLCAVFGVDAELYRDPHGQWALSVIQKQKVVE